MTSILRSLCLRQIGAILVLPLVLASVDLGCSKATPQASETSSASNSTVLAISTEPASVEVTAPASATFSVVAAGTSLTYQWQRKSAAADYADIADNETATTANLTLASTSAADSGSMFKVTVKDSTGQEVVSSEATLTVADATSKPVINSFAPDNATISAGGSAILTWDVTGATSLSIDSVGTVTGTTTTVTPTATTIYVLTATNAYGTATASTTVTLNGTPTDTTAPVISSFAASSSSVSAGRSIKLSWVVSNATSLSIDNGIGAVAGDYITITPTATTTYTLTATNANSSTTSTATVNVASAELPVIDSFAASASVIGIGKSSMLAWKVSNATSVTIDNGVGTVTDKNYISVKPVATTTYTMTATNAAGSVTATVTISINEKDKKHPKKHYHPHWGHYSNPWDGYYGW